MFDGAQMYPNPSEQNLFQGRNQMMFADQMLENSLAQQAMQMNAAFVVELNLPF